MEFNDLNKHQAEAILITCIDFRFHQAVLEYVKKNLAVDFDLLTIPGVAKNFALGNGLAQQSKDIIKNVSLPLHHIKKIILLNHWDCGGYGGSASFSAPEAEEQKYQADLKQAREILTNDFPELQVIIGYSKVQNGQLDFIIL